MKNRFRLYSLAVLLVILLSGCGNTPERPVYGDPITEQTGEASDWLPLDDIAVSPDSPSSDTLLSSPAEEAEEEREPRELTLMAVGDNLMHLGVVYAGRQADQSLDYSFLFEGIEELLETADIKVINQETIFGGNSRGFSGFPYFNSPTEVGDAIAAAGFNVVLHATNHAADQDLDGLLYCAEYWESHPEVLMTGITKESSVSGGDIISSEALPILTIEDTDVAILNYTYAPNMGVLPRKLQGHLNLLCAYDPRSGAIDFTTLHPGVLEDISRASRLADLVIVFPHWGTEYSVTPSRYQREWAAQMTEAGADLIIGTHPHVVQPVEWIEAENGNRALCFYSLGNYISTQKEPISMLEALAYVTFREDETGTMVIVPDRSGAIPLVCQYTSGPVRAQGVFLLEDYTQELADAHGIRSYGGKPLRLSDLEQWTEEILGEQVLSRDQIKD